jgi:hypothetical protein
MSPWIEVTNHTAFVAPVVRNTADTGISTFGRYYMETQVLDGQSAWIEQNVDFCARKKYTVTAWARSKSVRPGGTRRKPAPACNIQMCEAIGHKCSRQSTLKPFFTKVTKTFKATRQQTSGTIYVKVTCPNHTPGFVNTVFIDEISVI